MSRPYKRGFEWSQHNTDFYYSERVRKLFRLGGNAVLAYQFINDVILRYDGFYFGLFNSDGAEKEEVDFIIDTFFRGKEGGFRQFLNYCFKKGIYNKQLFEDFKLLTSVEVQETFADMVFKAKRKQYGSKVIGTILEPKEFQYLLSENLYKICSVTSGQKPEFIATGIFMPKNTEQNIDDLAFLNSELNRVKAELNRVNSELNKVNSANRKDRQFIDIKKVIKKDLKNQKVEPKNEISQIAREIQKIMFTENAISELTSPTEYFEVIKYSKFITILPENEQIDLKNRILAYYKQRKGKFSGIVSNQIGNVENSYKNGLFWAKNWVGILEKNKIEKNEKRKTNKNGNVTGKSKTDQLENLFATYSEIRGG